MLSELFGENMRYKGRGRRVYWSVMRSCQPVLFVCGSRQNKGKVAVSFPPPPAVFHSVMLKPFLSYGVSYVGVSLHSY